MKRVLVMSAILACLSLQANAEIQPKGVVFYGGAGLTASLTKSDFSMDCSVDKDNFPTANSPIYVSHKKNHIGRIGAELFIGVKSKCKNGWFWAGELGYGFAKSNHKHDFPELEDVEVDNVEESSERISYIDIEHGNELGLVGKFGRSINFWNVYGILGVTTKEVKIKYGLNHNHIDLNQNRGSDLVADPSKRVYGAVFGIGVSKQVHNKISCAIEYKYKMYQDAKKDVDWTRENSIFTDNSTLQHDTSNRYFKVKSDKHELSLRVAVNI